MKGKKKDSQRVAKVVIIDGDEILLLKRSNYLKKHKGEWDLPGGHLHIGEDIEAGLKREVYEETGLSIEGPEFVFKKGNDSFFIVKSKYSEITLSKEHRSWARKKADEISKLKNLTNYYRAAIFRCLKKGKENESVS